MAMDIDWRYECDAPKYRDFQEASTGSRNSAWFDTHVESPGAVQSAPALEKEDVLADLSNAPAEQPEGDAAEQPSKKARKNIVTSWGTEDPVKKRKAEEGASQRHAAKATKNENQDPAAQASGPAQATTGKRTKRSRAADKEARREIANQGPNLKVTKPVMKVKRKVLAAQLPRRVMPARSMKITVPDEIELQTSKRAAAHANNQVVVHQDDGSDGDTDNSGDASPYKPLVLRVKEFDKTPSRFKRKPDEPAPSKPLGITMAKEPQLQTSARMRPSVFKPREELEAEEMSKMPVFRASTLNPLILSTSGLLGVPKVDKRETTEPQPFSFVTDDRADARAARLAKQKQQEEEQQRQQQQERQRKKLRFERQTVSDGEGDEPAGKSLHAKARKSMACHAMEPLVPRSPLLRTKFRARETKAEEQRFEFHARPLPKLLSLPSLELPKVETVHVPTKPEPFRLATEERGVHHRTTLESKLKEEEKAAQRARIPRANGLPLSTDMPMVPPKPESRKLTVPEPFNLVSEVRHSKYEEQKKRELEEEEAAKRAEAEFKAKPMWRGIPFRKYEVDVPLTVPEPVSLRTSARVAAREEFNKLMEEKLKQMEAAAKQAEEEKRLREEEERRKLRKAAVFHALPMPDLSAPPAAKPPPPPKPLTKPVSPALGRRKRRRSEKKQREEDA